jgi:hypothetical protein
MAPHRGRCAGQRIASGANPPLALALDLTGEKRVAPPAPRYIMAVLVVMRRRASS